MADEARTRARAVARALALNARQALGAAERELRAAGDEAAADSCRGACDAVSEGPITVTYDGPPEAFACRRGA